MAPQTLDLPTQRNDSLVAHAVAELMHLLAAGPHHGDGAAAAAVSVSLAVVLAPLKGMLLEPEEECCWGYMQQRKNWKGGSTGCYGLIFADALRAITAP